MKTCPACGGGLTPVDDILNNLDGYIILSGGFRCIKCGEEIIPEDEAQRMILIAKKLGVWGTPLKLYRKLSKSAGGTVLRIPSDIEHNLNLKGDEQVAISKVGRNKILIEVGRIVAFSSRYFKRLLPRSSSRTSSASCAL